MKVEGVALLNAPVERVWDALLDPAVLVATIPGCESLQATGPHAYAMTVTAGVASIKGTYTGTCALSDLVEHRSLTLTAAGAGGPGTVSADVAVTFEDADGATRLTYAADAVVGGMIGGVGQRLLTSVSKRLAGEFFGGVEGVLNGTTPAAAPTGPRPAAATGEVGEVGEVFTVPAPAVGGPVGPEFVRGLLAGAGLVTLGVVLGGLLGRRR